MACGKYKKKEGGMGKYISAFNEIDLLMEGLFERLKNRDRRNQCIST